MESSTKTRIVFEGNAKSSKSAKCLNSCLQRGPNLIANLVGIWLRCRMKNIMLIADIKAAYVQLALNERDRDTVRFLWLKDVNKEVADNNILELRFCRVIWGIVSAAFLLAFVLMLHLNKYNTPVSRDISSNLYVDNLISGEKTVAMATDYYHDTKKIFESAGMNMCKWSSNNDDVMMSIKEEDRCSDDIVKVLGTIWNRKLDTLSLCRFDYLNGTITKSFMLKVLSSVFDPPGLFAPVVLELKLVLQEAWRANLEWDKRVPDEIAKQWTKKIRNFDGLHSIQINRCVANNVDEKAKYELVTFTDASIHAYAATVYLLEKVGNVITPSLVFCKSRLAPIKGDISIPRLELLGVVIGCRVSQFVANHLRITARRRLFTDSKCTIEWINSKKTLKKFVNERIKEIKSDKNVVVCYVAMLNLVRTLQILQLEDSQRRN